MPRRLCLAVSCAGLALAVLPAGLARTGEEDSPPLPSPDRPASTWLKRVDAGASDRRLAGYSVPEGGRRENVAERPAIERPLALAFARDGTPLVLEDQSSRSKAAVRALSSAKPEGPWDRAATLVEDDGARSLLVHDGQIYLAGADSVRRYRPAKPGGAPDVREVIIRGLARSLESVPGMTVGLDGWLYLAGGVGEHHLEGADGSRATVLGSGAVFRCRPDGSRLETFAIGLGNGRGAPLLDPAGHLFHADAVTTEGLRSSARLLHVPDGADLGWRSGVRRPAIVEAMARPGSSVPGGLLLYHDTRLPEQFRGLLFLADPTRRVVRAYRLEPAGASFRVRDHFDFLIGPRSGSFRPTQLVLGPDGAVYVLDPGQGRIHRLHWSGTKAQPALPLRGMDSWAKATAGTDRELIEALSSEEESDREQIQQELGRRGDRNRTALVRLLNDDEASLAARVHVLGALQSMYDDSVQKAFLAVLADSDGELQRLAAEGLGRCAKKGDRTVHDALLRALAIEDRAIRRAVALAMGRIAGPGAGSNLTAALSFDDTRDPHLREGLVRALELLGKPGMEALIALADSGSQSGTDRAVEAFLLLRTRNAFEALPRLLRNPHVSAGQRAELLRSCGNYRLDPPVSLDPLVDWVVAEKEPAAVRQALLEALAAPGLQKGTRSEGFVLAAMDSPLEEVRKAAVTAAGQMRLSRAVPALKTVLADKDNLGLRREAFLALARVAPATAVAHAQECLPGADAFSQREAVQLLGKTPAGAREMGRLLVAGKLPHRLQTEIEQVLRGHADRDEEAARLLREIGRRTK